MSMMPCRSICVVTISCVFMAEHVAGHTHVTCLCPHLCPTPGLFPVLAAVTDAATDTGTETSDAGVSFSSHCVPGVGLLGRGVLVCDSGCLGLGIGEGCFGFPLWVLSVASCV